jgi:hypothetical protein
MNPANFVEIVVRGLGAIRPMRLVDSTTYLPDPDAKGACKNASKVFQ